MQLSCRARDTSVPVILREQPRTSQKIALGGRDYLIVGVRSGCLINLDHVVFVPLIAINVSFTTLVNNYLLLLLLRDTTVRRSRDSGFATRVRCFVQGGL